jgi:hypothetical protein
MSAMEQILEGPLLAGSVRSPMSASEHPSTKIPSFADRQLSGNRDGWFGHLAAAQINQG